MLKQYSDRQLCPICLSKGVSRKVYRIIGEGFSKDDLYCDEHGYTRKCSGCSIDFTEKPEKLEKNSLK